jgi:hypothetical protein
MKNEKFTSEQIADVFWNYLKKDPEHKDRRMTAWGSKTKLGLALTVKRLGESWHVESKA